MIRKPIELRVVGNTLSGRQKITLQITSRRTGQRIGIGVVLEDCDQHYMPLEAVNRRLLRFAWLRLRAFFRDHRRMGWIEAIHISGTVGT